MPTKWDYRAYSNICKKLRIDPVPFHLYTEDEQKRVSKLYKLLRGEHNYDKTRNLQ